MRPISGEPKGAYKHKNIWKSSLLKSTKTKYVFLMFLFNEWVQFLYMHHRLDTAPRSQLDVKQWNKNKNIYVSQSCVKYAFVSTAF